MTISIIIPIYNCEKTLERCLNSIQTQTFTDFECLLINDGSKDKSEDICRTYCQKDSRFCLYSQQNTGVSAARNLGIENALGDYIFFVDGDDWLESNTLQALYENISIYNCDIVQCGYVLTDGNVVFDRVTYEEGYFDINKHFLNSCWGKLIKKELLIKNDINFPVGIALAEDMHFSLLAYLNSSKTYVLKDCFYNYYYNEMGAGNTFSVNKINGEAFVIKDLMSKISFVEDKSIWLDFLSYKKIICKKKYLFCLEKPDFALFKVTFPEMNDYFLKRETRIKRLFYLLIFRNFKFIPSIFCIFFRIIKKYK